MFNLGFSEIIILSILALIFIGPKQLPEMARVLGRLLNELKRATGELSSTLTDFKHQATHVARQTEEEIRQQIVLDSQEKSPIKNEQEIQPSREGSEKKVTESAEVLSPGNKGIDDQS